MRKQKAKKIGCLNNEQPSKMLNNLDVDRIKALYEQTKSKNKVARITGFSPKTVRKYLHDGVSKRRGFLYENQSLIRQWFLECEGHCVPLQRVIEQRTGEKVHLRVLQEFCKPIRKEIKATIKTCRYETQPGQHMQIDFGERNVVIAGNVVRVHFFAAVLGFSRRIFAKAYPVENQAVWLDGIESAFQFFDGIPMALVIDNTKSLVIEHRRRGETRLTAGFEHFCQYWKVRAIAATPYHPQCKGKVERAVRYVKENALVGKRFSSMKELNAWLEQWSLTYADHRRLDLFENGLQTPKERFLLEKNALQRVNRAHIAGVREETRHVDRNGLVRVDNVFFRLPDAVRNTDVQILIDDNSLVVSRKGVFVIELDKAQGVYQPTQQPAEICRESEPLPPIEERFNRNTLQRPLEDYAAALGGAWK